MTAPRSEAPPLRWSAPDRFTVDGVEFVESFLTGSTAQRFNIRKRAQLVEDYVEVLGEFRGGTVVELGIAQGGSLALMVLVAAPRKVVALELSPVRITGLDDLVAARGLQSSVRAYYGVDQADADRVLQIVRDEIGDVPLDLVIDDASHLLGPTRASFDVLFPLLRPGGLYLIEDWNWQHKMTQVFHRAATDPESAEAKELQRRLKAAMDDPTSPVHDQLRDQIRAELADESSKTFQSFAASLEERLEDPAERARFEALMEERGEAPDEAPTADPAEAEPRAATGWFQEMGDDAPPDDAEPLAALVVDLLLARACDGDVVSEVTIGEFWAGARRGPAALVPGEFHIGEHYGDPHGLRWRAPVDDATPVTRG